MNKEILSLLLLWALGLPAIGQERQVVYLPDSVPMAFIRIPAGSFLMGNTENDPHAQGDEFPQRPIEITSDFFIGQTEVTQAQWEALMGFNPSVFQDKNRPVEMVSWYDCQDFIEKINRLGLGTFRLPTEAEWEYAGQLGGYAFRDSTRHVIPWQLRRYAWFHSESEGQSHPAGRKEPGENQLLDMMGNLWEWVSDWYGPYPAGAAIDPTGPGSGEKKVYRGGSWFNEPEALRIPNRNAHPPDQAFTNAGFRLVLEVQ